MFDFISLPPEINSGRLYAGPGAGSLASAASAWRQIANELDAAATGYNSVFSSLAGAWYGPSAAAMRAAAAPYAQWLSITAMQAVQLAVQAEAAVTAFELAHRAVVPPEVIAANRIELAQLLATNVFGQNSAAIAAVEGLYAEMWAQDAAAMTQYCASSQTVTATISPFQSAPLTANPAGARAAESLSARALGAAEPSGQLPTSESLLPGLPTVSSGVPGSLTQALISSGFPINALTLLVSAGGYSGMVASNAANHPFPVALGLLASPGSLSAPGAIQTSLAAPLPTNSAVASVATGRSLSGLTVPASWNNKLTMAGPVRPLTTSVDGPDQVIPVGAPIGPAAAASGNGGKGRRGRRSHPDDYEYGLPVRPLINRHPLGG